MADKVKEARAGVNAALERAMRCLLPSSTDSVQDAGDAFDGAVRALIAAVREETKAKCIAAVERRGMLSAPHEITEYEATEAIRNA